jgi:hypothetical protein
MADNRDEMLAHRWAELLRRWLAALPSAGWSGSPSELTASLDQADAEMRMFAHVPGSHAIARVIADAKPIFTTAGWSITFGRTGRGRRIEVRPLAGSV